MTHTLEQAPTWVPEGAKWYEGPRLLKLADAEYPFWVPEGCYYEPSLAEKFQTFCEDYLIWSHGFRQGEPVIWEQWQLDRIIRPALGIREIATDKLIIRTIFYLSARGTGKTAIAAALGLFGLTAMGIPSPEIDVFACSKEQAQRIYGQVDKFIRSSPELMERLTIHDSKKMVKYPDVRGELVVRSGDDKAELGLNPSMVLFDELLAQKDEKLWNTIKTSMGKRPDSLLVMLTTPSLDTEIFAKDEYDYAKEVSREPGLDPSYLPVIFEADEKDDPFAEETWHKAAPSLKSGFLDIEVYREEAARAKKDKTKLRAFKVYRLAIWAESGRAYIDMVLWDDNVQEVPSNLSELPCYFGVDMAGSSDLAALCILWWDEAKEEGYMLWEHWSTHDMKKLLNDWTHGHWDTYCEDSASTITHNDEKWIKAEDIANRIMKLAGILRPVCIGLDMYRCHDLNSIFEEHDFETKMLSQTGKAMQAATERFGSMVPASKLKHNGDPIARYCATNCEIIMDSSGYPKVVKKDLDKRKVRIDSISAGLMAMDRRLEDERTPKEPESYAVCLTS